MVIQARHFDVRLNQWIHVDGNQNNQDSILQEKISNTLLERFLPGKEFSFGHMDKDVSDEQLKNHPNGDKLLLSSKTRLLYGPEECLEIIDQICPDRKDRGAYGSVFLGGCRTALDVELNVLIVDDSSGDNGGVIDNDQAYRLTGDCYGQIANDVYHQITGHQDGDKYKVIQHRFGWTPEDGDDNKFRFGKGTFRPANLDENTLRYTATEKPKIDVIIPLSSFKGTDKDNPSGPTKPQIKPGLYKQKVWIGEKSQSELGKTAISQVLASFPQGIKDFTEIIENVTQKLAAAEKDPRKLAELYCEKYEKRKDYLENEANNLEDEISEEFDEDKQNNVIKLRERLENDSFIYKVIKADLAGNGQLLETEKVKNELTKFVQGEWRDIAIGKKLQFERALVIPSKELNNGEIYIPKYNEGEEVLNFRSPFLNANGMCVSFNKKVEDALGPDGKRLEGIIVVSDETSERIYKRLSKQIEEILPQAIGASPPRFAIAQGIKWDGIEEYLNRGDYDKLKTPDKVEFTDKFNEYVKTLNEAGFDIEILPYESEQERQARDYDGDCIGFERASKYPNLAAEAVHRNLPENAYAPTIKLKKASFYNEAGEQPSFEAIAKHMSDGISVGIINNHLTSIEALESEMEVVKQYGSDTMRLSYVNQVSEHYEKLLRGENPEKPHTILPDKYREYIQEFVEKADAAREPTNPNRQESAMGAMAVNKTIYRELIADAAYQNQIAVDLFKSATKPDIESINQNSRLLHRKVNYIKDKKSSKVYDTETISATGYSPVELVIAKTNQYFRKSQLESRDLSQFQDFFKDIEFTNQQRLMATLAKKEFDTKFNTATRFSKRRETEKGPGVELELADGKKLDVSNLLDAKHPDIWNAKSMRIKVIPIDEDKISSSKPHKYAVMAQIDGRVDENGKPKAFKLGNISKEQEFNLLKEMGIELGKVIDVKNHEIKPGFSEGQVKLLYNQAYEVARNFYESIPEEEKLSMAAATWAISTTRESTSHKNAEISDVQQEVEKAKKVSNFVFVAFENEIIQRIDELQFTTTKVTNFDKNSSVFQQETTEVRYNIDSDGKDIIEVKDENGKYQPFANLEGQTGRLPIGTTAEANITYNQVYTATVTSQLPGKTPFAFNIGELSKYQLGEEQFGNGIYQLEIVKVNRPKEDYVITTEDDKGKKVRLGTIDDKSVKEGIEQGWLKKNGQNLQLKLTQIASSTNSYAVGQTPDGNFFRINIDKNFNGNINDPSYQNVTVNAYDTPNVYIAKIDGKELGKIGVLPAKPNPNKPNLVERIIGAGLIDKGVITATIPVTIQRNQTTASVAINQETIKYPDEWVKRRQLLNVAEKEVTLQEKVSNTILEKINTRPTMLFQSKEQLDAGKIGFVVDENNAEKTKSYLDQKGIKYEEIPHSQAKVEAKKGVAVLMVDKSTVNKEVMDVFLERANGIKNNDISEQKIPVAAEQSVYFIDPNQKYGVNEKGAIGLVVANNSVNATQSWFDTKGADINIIKGDTTTTIVAKAESISEELRAKLDATLGQPIDVSTVEGFDKYEADAQKLSEAVKNKQIAAPVTEMKYSEYQAALRQLPNRPKDLIKDGQEQSLPIAPSAPLKSMEVDVRQPNTVTGEPAAPPNAVLQTNGTTDVPTTPQQAIPPKDNGYAPSTEKVNELYDLIQNTRFNLPPGSPGVDNASSLDDSPIRAAIAIKTEAYPILGYDAESTILAVDFRQIESVRNLLHEKAIEFDEAIGEKYAVDAINSSAELLQSKGYYTFTFQNGSMSPEILTDIKQTINVQNELNIDNKALNKKTNDLTKFAEQLPDPSQNVGNAIDKYIENSDRFLNEWYSYIQSNAERYVSAEYPPTQNVIEFIDKVPSLSQEQLSLDVRGLNPLEVAWIKVASENNMSIPTTSSGEEWDKFIEETLINNFYKVAARTDKFITASVNEVKNIIQIEKESLESLDGNKLTEATQLQSAAIEKYGEKSYQRLEDKANNAIKSTNQLETSSPTLIKFKGIHNDSTNQNHGGIEIIPNNGKAIKLSQNLGEGTSQQAEYQALIVGLKKAKEIGVTNIKIESDAQNTIFQLQGKYKVNNEELKPLYNEAQKLIASFDKAELEKITQINNSNARILARGEVQAIKVKQNQAKIAEKFTQISESSTLNDQQKEALNKMIAFTQQPKSGSSKDNEFLLTGYAGTGKTYIIQQLLKTLEASGGQQTKICFTAPTNAAVKVLRKMGKEQGLDADTSTTHSLLGLKEQYDKITGEVSYDTNKQERNPKYLQYDTIVVDEGSMVNKQLREKLEEVAQKGVKVIYMGDRAQLPPVKESESLVFQIENCANLTEVMRYGGDIGETAKLIRDDIENSNPAPIASSNDDTIVSLNAGQFKEAVIKLFTSESFKEDNSSVKILAYTNKRVDEINALVKNELFAKDAPEYLTDMRLIARAPVTKEGERGMEILLHNSDEMTITQATKIEENGYKVWELTGVNEENEEITFKTITEESKGKFLNDVQKLFAAERVKAAPDRDWSIPYTYKDQYADVRPAYAITVHNSQGKTIKVGGVDEENINKRLSMALKETDPEERTRGIKEHNQLMYVAMTRFKEQIFVLGSQQERSVSVEDKLAQAHAALGKDDTTPAKQPQTEQPIVLPSSQEADKSKPIEIMGKISTEKVEALRAHIETNIKPLLEDDKSNYSPGRQVAWVGAKWNLQSKDFEPGVQDNKLMELVKQVYPDAAIALVTYSPNASNGINYHRDDSYAANEARSINIGNSEWGYRAAKGGMAVSKDENNSAQYHEFPLLTGTVTRFNCKNEHAAINTEAGRWSINIWTIKNDLGRENSVREKFDNFIASNQPPRAVVQSDSDLTIKANEWTPGGEIKVERAFDNIKEAIKNTATPNRTPITRSQTNSTNPNIEDIIKVGNETQARLSKSQIPTNPTISGKPVTMGWDLTNPDKNLGASTTIDAMRSKGRVHSTRSENYYQKYGIKEGDIAIAQGKDGKQVAFRVGKQYKITQETIDNPDYQRAWVNWEKHDIKELTGRQADKVKEGRPLYGLFMEPLGDYNNGKIVPFATQQQQTSPAAVAESMKINPTTGMQLGAVLSNATVLARVSGTVKNDYQVSVNGNPQAPPGKYGRETHEFKPDGVPYNSAEHAFEHQKQVTPDKDPYKIMVEVLQAKLEQHPQITKTIAKKGGIADLENAQITNENDKQWEGKGKDSKFIRALTEAYTTVVEKSNALTPPALNTNLLASLKPLNDLVAKHTAKDVAMAEVATQFIGKSAAPLTTESTTRNYESSWGQLANTGNYSKNDTVMVSGSGPWRGVTNQQINQTFENHYKPLLDKAIIAEAKIVVGTAVGTDKLVQNYLRDNGYKLEQNSKGYVVATANEKIVTSESTPPPVVTTPPAATTPPVETTPPVAPINDASSDIAPGIIISARSKSPLGAALTSTTVKSKQVGSIDKDYAVSFRGNDAIAKGNYGPETYTDDKPAGQPFASVEQAFHVYKETIENLGEARVNLLAEIQQAKFEQHPDLLEAVKENGGVEWLKECTYKVGSKNDFWEGKGEESPYIRSLIKGYENAIQITNTNENNTSTPSSNKEVIAPPRETHYKTLAQEIPKEIPNGSQNIPAFGKMDDIIEQARTSTINMLSNWQEVAQKLGKSEAYLNRIEEVTESYKNDKDIPLENSFIAMAGDMKELEKLNNVTRMVQRVANTVGRMDNNNVLGAKTTNGYEFVIASSDKNLLVRDQPENGSGIILYIKEGQVKENKIDDNFIKNLRIMNFKIDNALSDVKSQLVV